MGLGTYDMLKLENYLNEICAYFELPETFFQKNMVISIFQCQMH